MQKHVVLQTIRNRNYSRLNNNNNNNIYIYKYIIQTQHYYSNTATAIVRFHDFKANIITIFFF